MIAIVYARKSKVIKYSRHIQTDNTYLQKCLLNLCMFIIGETPQRHVCSHQRNVHILGYYQNSDDSNS